MAGLARAGRPSRAPAPPTWREHLRPLGYTFETQEDYERACREMSLEPEDVDKHLDGYGWASYWEHNESPQAKAAILLKELKLDCALHARGEGGADLLHGVRGAPWKLREVGGLEGRPHRVPGAAHRARSAHQACRRFTLGPLVHTDLVHPTAEALQRRQGEHPSECRLP